MAQDDQLLPDSADDFTPNQATIDRFTVKEITDEPFAVINSNVAAWIFGRIRIGRVQTQEVMPHGFAAHTIKSYQRQRQEIFSPRSTNRTGPLVADMLDRYIVDLIGAGL